ncbi:uncharacterized protein LOC143904853 [Temnothorax americanus]|uniref:uncharacterized protein LOC143904853 n=1 Tax=Temnothorax americanus TaxID=1964332 RepID=UPI0040675831
MLTANSRLPTAHAFSRLTAYIDAQDDHPSWRPPQPVSTSSRQQTSGDFASPLPALNLDHFTRPSAYSAWRNTADIGSCQAKLLDHRRTGSAIHLEVVSDYSSEGFIAAFRRFSARRGIAQTIYLDCGTTFIGADAALKKMFIQSSQEHQRIAQILQQYCTRWEFNPPGAPHMGGKWEAVVKSVKFHLRRTIGETLLTTEELTTLLTQIEAILNSRPLEPLSDDPENISALTPSHFLIGGPLTTIPEPSLIDLATSRLSRWQLIQQRVQHFWAQWSAHYLQRQQAISKWHHPNNNIKVGSIVLLTDERSPPCKWPHARVTALHPGKDGLTRAVTLKTATTTLTRPSAKLAIIPISTE